MNKNVTRRTKWHDFKDTRGKSISYAVICAALGESEQWVRTRLKQEKAIPTDFAKWIKSVIAPGSKKVSDLKMRQEEADALLKEAKVEELTFKNEITQGKYMLAEDVQRAIDGMLIRLGTNLDAIPDSIVDAVMTSRNRTEGKQVIKDAIDHHRQEVSEWQIQITADD